jgi:3-deoxy-D-manno-octulosonic-acid transferase
VRPSAPGAIWVHAVSVGEVIGAIELLKRMRTEMPYAPRYVSVTTLAGRAMADQKLKGLADAVFYTPLDYCFAVRRVLRRLRPAVLVVMETEIWPNMWREAKRFGCGLVVVNARISDRAVGRYRRLKWFFAPVLRQADVILAQSAQDVDRYRGIGGDAVLGGNLKYDFDPRHVTPSVAVRELIRMSEPEHIWIAASTMPPADSGDVDEDDVVLDAYERLMEFYPRMMLILVPRRPERFDIVANKLVTRRLMFMRRSFLTAGERVPLPCVLLVDTIGELSSLFPLAQAVFMGGTLAKRGGHNILEPAFFSLPVIAGPHMENFAAIAAEFTAAGALVRMTGDLVSAVDDLLDDPARCAEIGAKALALAESKRGAAARAMTEILRVYELAVPRSYRWYLPAATWLWRHGSRIKRGRDHTRRGTLHAPVVSVGGISMGGSGKTPFVLWLARRLNRPAILTRGYRRRDSESPVVLEAGEAAPVSITGDEAQIFLRAGVAPVGIGADRFQTGQMLEERFHPEVILLDDGFQHWKLERSLDIVLVDALDPLAGGLLREGPGALSRAGAVVITRADSRRTYAGLRALIARHSYAPVFTARVKPAGWVDWDGEGKPAAFCGLANPASFWKTLEQLEIEPVNRTCFGDHHHYTARDLRRLKTQAIAAGATLLLTTEKDYINLPQDAAEIVAPLRVAYLRIDIEVDNEPELLALVRKAVNP